jgi:cobalamin biosynthesis protein CobT
LHSHNFPSFLQVTDDSDEDDDGSIFDNQDVVIEDSGDDNSEDDGVTEASSSPKEAVDSAEDSQSDDMDERLEHMLEIEDNNGAVVLDKKPESTKSTNLVNANNGKTLVRYVTVNDYNYHIKEFDSSVKHDVYPSPETDSMVSYGVLFMLFFMGLLFLLKLFSLLVKSTSVFKINSYKK